MQHNLNLFEHVLDTRFFNVTRREPMAQEFVTQDENITTSGLPARSEKLDGADMKPIPTDDEALFPSGESTKFRKRWADIQASFVDEPSRRWRRPIG